MTITEPRDLITISPLTRAGALPAVSRVSLAGRMIGTVTDEGGAVPSRGSYHAWSLAFGPKGFHTTQAKAVERLVSVWLCRGWGPTTLITGPGTIHASRPSTLPVPNGRVPACMTDRAASGLRVLLLSGRNVTCRHCPKN
ncbi:hypothetical protein [Streptomyces sp. NPDC059708]|uniref:hypothetical protein n=1 Tax=Streptomyces sp. NPDC059708 TaxID=3346916 RepID=UPI0036B0DFD5